MKKILNILSFMLATVLLITGCQLDDPDLESPIAVSKLSYEITQNPDDPNMVILESLTPDVIPMWITPTGRSTKVKDTVKLPFSGSYQFIYNVASSGGIVYGDTTNLNITTTNLSYVDDPLWNTLTGGVGESKTWVLDLDEDGVSKYFLGPMYFYGSDNGWQGDCLVEGGDCWNWNPDWAGNSWVADLGDYGEMTFSLDGGAFLTANHSMIPSRGEENGTFFLDVNNYTFSSNNASVIHSPNYEDCVENWGSARLFSLTEDYMQLGFLRKSACEGAAMLVFNYISKEYSDNWVPADTPDPEPPYDGDANGDLTTSSSTSKTWTIDLAYPYNWHDLSGVAKNEVATYGTDPEGFAFTSWTPPYDEALFSSVSMQLTKTADAEGTYVIVTGGQTYEGAYTVNENNEIDFGQAISLFEGVGGWLNFGTTANNTLRIIQAEETAGSVTGIWLGQKAEDKDEYLSIHLKATAGSGAEDPEDVIKAILVANPWQIDSDRTYDEPTSWGAEQGPIIFSDFATWAWNPLPGDHYGAGEADVDYGQMTFNDDGTFNVIQRKRIYTYVDSTGATVVRNGMPEEDDVLASDEEVTINGIWALDLDGNKLRLSVPMLHPWTCDFAVAEWGDITIQKIEEDVLIFKVLRDAELSGEDEFLMAYVFVPDTE